MRNRPRLWLLVTFTILMAVIGTGIFWSAGVRADQVVMEWTKRQESTLARAGALSINEFFQGRRANLLFLTEKEAVRLGEEKEGRLALQQLVDDLKDQVVASVVRVSKEGVVLWSENPEGQNVEEGVDLADRDYFLWAKEQGKSGEVFISEPLISRGGLYKGEHILAMASPLFYQNKFNGLVFISFPIKQLLEKYVSPLSFSAGMHAFLVTEKGEVITSGLVTSETKGLLAQAQKEERAGEAIVASAPIKINNQTWALWVVTPYKEAVSFASYLKSIQFQGFALGLVGGVALVLVFIFGVRKAQKEAFVDGFKNGRDRAKKTRG